MRTITTHTPKTSDRGHFSICVCCPTLVWVDTTHGTPPGPDICSTACYEKHSVTRSNRMPAWAVE